jgi:thiol-disulfide isomerase/thioredoxin
MARYFSILGLVLAATALAGCSSSTAEEGEEEADLQTAKARKEFFEQLDSFFSAKDDDAAKKAPDVLKDVKRFLGKTKKDGEQFQVAMIALQVLEAKGQGETALKLAADLKTHYADADKKLATAAAKLYESAEKRLAVIGKPLNLEGTLVGGEKFDWSKYKGKVVLVDFWATWCGPCRQELPNVKENYEKHHDKGFEVVGISLDDDVEALNKFIKTEKLPWENLLPADESQRGWKNPLADKFGVEGIPFTMLVNRQGKVVALNVRGDALGEQLGKLLNESAEKK